MWLQAQLALEVEYLKASPPSDANAYMYKVGSNPVLGSILYFSWFSAWNHKAGGGPLCCLSATDTDTDTQGGSTYHSQTVCISLASEGVTWC